MPPSLREVDRLCLDGRSFVSLAPFVIAMQCHLPPGGRLFHEEGVLYRILPQFLRNSSLPERAFFLRASNERPYILFGARTVDARILIGKKISCLHFANNWMLVNIVFEFILRSSKNNLCLS